MAPRSRTPMDPAARADPAALAAHAEAIRRLARSLVADDSTADDVAQETMRVGLEHPPRAGYSPLAWLAGIARNVVRGLRRTERRRLARETAAARTDAAPSAADAVLRLAERRRVVDAVLALDEPYRSTIALRWFDGLPPREIARRQGVPVETARTRCKRGLELLRAELCRRHGGDRRAWMAALFPLTHGGGAGLAAGLSSLIGGVLVTTTSKVVVGSVAVLLLAGGAWMAVRGTLGPTEDRSLVAPPPVALSDASTTLAAQPSARTPNPATAATALVTADPHAVRGRVLGPDGVPVAARIQVVPRDVPSSTEGAPTTVAAADGTFTVAVGDATEMRVAATADGFAPVAATARAGVPIELRMRRDRMLALRIVDDATRGPIAGATIESIEVKDGFEHVARATSDVDGNADVRDPAGPFPDPFAPPRLRVRAGGHRSLVLSDTGTGFPRSMATGRRFEVALSSGAGVAVRVLRPDGTTPAAGVVVRGFAGWGLPVAVGVTWRALRHASTALGEAITAVDGTATLDPAETNTPLWLVAEAPGLHGVRCVRESPTIGGVFDLVLRPTLSISGRVVDGNGAPVASAMVQVDWREAMSVRKGPRDEVNVPPPAPLADRWQQFTDASGAFAVEGALAPDGSGEVALWAVAAGFDFGKAKISRPTEGPMAPVTIVLLHKAGIVTVRVRDTEARPVAGAIVGRPRAYPMAVTDAQGLAPCNPTFFPEGERKTVRIVAAGFALAWAALEEVPKEGPLDVVLERARGLDVRVVDADGKPVVAELLVGRGAVNGLSEQPRALWEDDPRSVARGVTDEDGGVRLEGLPPTVTTLVARESRVPTNQVVVTVAGDATQVDVRLPSRREDAGTLASVEGEVVDGEGNPLSTSQLTLSSDAQVYAPVQTGSRFRFDDVLPGTYRLEGWAAGTTVPIARRLTLSAGQEVKGMRLTPPRPATLTGTLRGDGLAEGGRLQADAVPAEAGAVGFRDESVDADGRFELTHLGPGTYRLVLRTLAPTGSERPLRVADGEFTIEEGATLERTFDLVPAARLWLRCDDERFADGQADMNHDTSKGPGPPKYEATRWSSVVVRDPAGRKAWSGWLLHGRHPIDTGLAPGRYRVTVNAVKLGAFEGEVDVPATGDVDVEITLTPPPAR